MSKAESSKASTKHVVGVLNACIEVCTDGEKGYAAAAADVRDLNLKALLRQKARERGDFVLALRSLVESLGAYAENEGSATGTAHRGLVDLRAALAGRSDRVFLEECARGEAVAQRRYEAALSQTVLPDFPVEARLLLQEQHAAIRRARENILRRLHAHGCRLRSLRSP